MVYDREHFAPLFVNVYVVSDLCQALDRCRAGCLPRNIAVDDLALVSPSATGMRELLSEIWTNSVSVSFVWGIYTLVLFISKQVWMERSHEDKFGHTCCI